MQRLHHTAVLETPEDSLCVPLDGSREALEDKTNQSTKGANGEPVYESA